jgi:uncharacterized MnhB-related membrane protein
MMATTHALAGVVLAAVALLFAPDAGPAVVLAGALGGLFPDFDLYAGHRKTLHFPVFYPVFALAAVGAAVLRPTPGMVAVTVFLLAAALHSVMDVAGGGLELKPWRGESERAVYDHARRRWLPPKRWVRYDGAPEDLALAGLFAAPSLVVFGSPVREGVLLALLLSAVYVLLRKPLVRVAEALVDALPPTVVAHVPERFLDDVR